MLTWGVTPHVLGGDAAQPATGHIPASARVVRLAAAWFSWIPLITAGRYAIVILLAQAQIDASARHDRPAEPLPLT